MTVLRFAHAFELSPRLEALEPLARCAWPGCGGACCLHGVWLDPLEVQDLRAHADQIAPWLPAGRSDPAQWFTSEREAEPGMPSGEVVAAQVVPNPAHYGGRECVFLRSDSKCALQAAGETAGFHPWRFKPFHCILHPLTFNETGLVSLAPLAEVLDEPASCLRLASEPRPLRELFACELEYLTREAVA
jgi:hypothetical protein